MTSYLVTIATGHYQTWGGDVLKSLVVLDSGFTEIFKAQCLLQIEGGLCLAVCRLVATHQLAAFGYMYAFG